MRSGPRRRRRSARYCISALPWASFPLLISVAQSGQAAHGRQHRIKRGLVRNGGIFGAQHAERTRMIFLRLLGPELVGKREAEFFPLLGKCLFVGACPGHELLPYLFGENWHHGWRQRGPGFERAPSALGQSMRCTQSSTGGAPPPMSAPAVGSVHIS